MRAGLSIGDFSQITHLSVKTLRRYHEAGLLRQINPIWARPLPSMRLWRVRMGHEQAAESAPSWRQACSHGTAGAAEMAALAVADRASRERGAVYLPARDKRQHAGQPELLAVHRGRQRPQDQDRDLRERRERLEHHGDR